MLEILQRADVNIASMNVARSAGEQLVCCFVTFSAQRPVVVVYVVVFYLETNCGKVQVELTTWFSFIAAFICVNIAPSPPCLPCRPLGRRRAVLHGPGRRRQHQRYGRPQESLFPAQRGQDPTAVECVVCRGVGNGG